LHTSKLRTGNDLPSSIVHDHKLTLDFRERPTRADVGLPAGRTFRIYSSDDPLLQTTVVLPTGTVLLPCFTVKIATDAAGGAIDSAAGETEHEPKYFDLFRSFGSAADAQQSLSADAKVLGLSQEEIDRTLPDLGKGGVVAQSRVLHGLVHDWLSIEVTLSDGDNGTVQAQYAISIDVYHNPAIDKVLHNGVVPLDLTTRPTRADLGFLPGYRTAVISPPWGESYRVPITVPGGSFEVPDGSVQSSAPSGSAPPAQTTVTTTSSLADAQRVLTASAAALGLDRVAVDAIFRGSSGRRVQQTLSGASTAVYTVTVRADVLLGQAGGNAASLSYRFVYR
jgi:hypothetical protein